MSRKRKANGDFIKAAKPVKKVAIVGAAPSSRSLAPYADETWEIWACSPSNRELPRITSWFELHSLDDLKWDRWEKWAKPYVEWLKVAKFRVMMQRANDLVPNAVAFPKDEMLAQHGPAFLSSSIAWMIALAMHEGATEISIYGVDMTANSEYDYERPGCKFWIEKARAAGIPVFIPPESDLDYPAPLYGFDDSSPMARKLKMHGYEMRDRMTQIERRLNEIDAEKAGLLTQHTHLKGAIDQNNHIRKTFVAWSGPDL